MSALDLFASAMGAFVLLAVMMLPYYHKGKDLEEQIVRLEPQVAESAAQAADAAAQASAARNHLEAIISPTKIDLSQEEAAVQTAEARRRKLEKQIETVAQQLEQKRAAATAAARPDPKPQSTKVSFRFLGLKTSADQYLILVDGAARIKERAGNLPAILKSIVGVMGPQKEFAISFYSYANDRMTYNRWPSSGYVAGSASSQAGALDFLGGAYASMSGGSPTAQALLQALSEHPEAVILVSDGVVYPPHNESRRWQQVVEDVTRSNASRVEINTVAVGIFNRDASFWTFLNELRKRNGGDLKAIPP
jgi:hypothetical protein